MVRLKLLLSRNGIKCLNNLFWSHANRLEGLLIQWLKKRVAILNKFTALCLFSYSVVYFFKLKFILFYYRIVYNYIKIFLILLLHPVYLWGKSDRIEEIRKWKPKSDGLLIFEYDDELHRIIISEKKIWGKNNENSPAKWLGTPLIVDL